MDRYEVICRRTGGWWALEVPDVPGAFSQVRRLEQAGDAIAEAIGMILGPKVAPFEVHLLPVIDDATDAAVARLREARRRREEAERAYHEQLEETAARLTEVAHLSMRDTGELLDVSHQYVAKVLARS